MTEQEELKAFLDGAFQTMDNVLARQEAELRDREIGIVKYVGYGIVRVGGLPNIRADELVLFPDNLKGLVFNIDPRRSASSSWDTARGWTPAPRCGALTGSSTSPWVNP